LKSLKGNRTKPLTGTGSFCRRQSTSRAGTFRAVTGEAFGRGSRPSELCDRSRANAGSARFASGRDRGSPSASFAASGEAYKVSVGRRRVAPEGGEEVREDRREGERVARGRGGARPGNGRTSSAARGRSFSSAPRGAVGETDSYDPSCNTDQGV